MRLDQSHLSSVQDKNMWILRNLMIFINCKGYLFSNDMRRSHSESLKRIGKEAVIASFKVCTSWVFSCRDWQNQKSLSWDTHCFVSDSDWAVSGCRSEALLWDSPYLVRRHGCFHHTCLHCAVLRQRENCFCSF